MAGQESLRAAAARDKDFVGVDITAMARLIHQMGGAADAVSAWLRTNGVLPPSVPRTGLRQAAAVNTWISRQSGMLTRRRDYAVAHLSGGGEHGMAHAGAGGLGRSAPRTTTPAGAGHTVGNFPDVHAAMRAGAADAARIRTAEDGHDTVPAEVWRHLAANAGDPDYAHALYDRLGPAGTAGLIAAARGDEEHLGAVRASLGAAGHHLTMNEKWLRALLDAALRDGARDDAVAVLAQAGLGHRAKVALGHLGLMEIAAAANGAAGATTDGTAHAATRSTTHDAADATAHAATHGTTHDAADATAHGITHDATHGTAPAAHAAPPDDVRPPHRTPPRHPGPPETIRPGPPHLFPAPRPPHEAMITPAADDPRAAVELYSRHPEALHRALSAAPHSAVLERLAGQATTARDADPAAVRANAERLAAFLGSRSAEAPR